MVPEKGNERIKKSDFSNRSYEFPGQKYLKNMTAFFEFSVAVKNFGWTGW